MIPISNVWHDFPKAVTGACPVLTLNGVSPANCSASVAGREDRALPVRMRGVGASEGSPKVNRTGPHIKKCRDVDDSFGPCTAPWESRTTRSIPTRAASPPPSSPHETIETGRRPAASSIITIRQYRFGSPFRVITGQAPVRVITGQAPVRVITGQAPSNPQ